MNVNDKIRMLREFNHWSQEEMAERLGMSHNGYAKIECGETKLYLDKLSQIAQIFNINLSDLVSDGEKNVFFFLQETQDHTSANYYGSSDLAAEIEKLKLIVAHKDEIIEQKNKELAAQQEIIALLKQHVRQE
ncbi:helix-turn-helix domain-containing protein [Eikenella corrodens]|uniref:Helix-turn-helix domain-containing protein n=1 Tax=Eikenella corrodens TaxID=539 RepID=A0A3S9SGK8_EIKCO|nr:helix-turn-helix domain-containing protein [Eikenella corrodens]AZR58675.1 helix-turn-helix domain-containing protein [Eikenella corrodens]